MNLLLLFPDDLTAPGRALVTGRRLDHVREIHRACVGDLLRVGVLGGKIGMGRVLQVDAQALELELELREDPPPKLPLTLILALPRPKVLNRVLASATSLGVARIVLLNAWKVEKSYWKSPRMADANLFDQRVLGLEQARDTVLPELRMARLMRPFVENELDKLAGDSLRLIAHPDAVTPCPRELDCPATLVIGPEGGWIADEVELFQRAGFTSVSLGPRILRTETALAHLVGRLY